MVIFDVKTPNILLIQSDVAATEVRTQHTAEEAEGPGKMLPLCVIPFSLLINSNYLYTGHSRALNEELQLRLSITGGDSMTAGF